MSVLKVDPPYKHLTQKRNFCGPACIQMILFRRGTWVDQERLAYALGAQVDEKDSKLYMLSFRKLPGDDFRIGVMITDFVKIEIKNTLERYNLAPEVHLVGTIENVKNFMAENMECDNDIIINFWWKPINGKEYGHYVLVSEFDTEKEMIRVCDPSHGSRSFWNIKLTKLKESMSSEWTGTERGFVIIRAK